MYIYIYVQHYIAILKDPQGLDEGASEYGYIYINTYSYYIYIFGFLTKGF